MFFLQNRLLKRLIVYFLPEKELHGQQAGVFISIPKNGTYSIKKILGLNKNAERKYGSVILSEKHQRGSVLDEKYNLNHPFVFCFSRNPYDRTVSWYEYHKDRGIEPYISLSFDEWVKKELPHHWDTLKGTNWEKEDISPLLQYNFISHCEVDFIGKIEHFERDMKKSVNILNKKLRDSGREPIFEYFDVQKNQSNRKSDISHYYTPQTRRIVAEKLHLDFVKFGYKK